MYKDIIVYAGKDNMAIERKCVAITDGWSGLKEGDVIETKGELISFGVVLSKMTLDWDKDAKWFFEALEINPDVVTRIGRMETVKYTEAQKDE